MNNSQVDLIASVLQDHYEVTVVFTRYLGQDLDYGLQINPDRFDIGLVSQFVGEMREAAEVSGEPAGFFRVQGIKFFEEVSGQAHSFAVSEKGGKIILTEEK